MVAIVAKAVGCGLFARVLGFDTLSSVRVGLGMISRGEVGLIVAGYGLEHRIISQSVFSACVIMVLVTTMVTPPLLAWCFPEHPATNDRSWRRRLQGRRKRPKAFAIIRVPLPRQRGGADEDRTKRLPRKVKHKRRPRAEDENEV